VGRVSQARASRARSEPTSAAASTSTASTSTASTSTASTSTESPTLRADARRNRELILAAADAAFADDGVTVPVDEIARRAGVGTGTLYRHFPTKEALFEAVLVAHMESLLRFGQELAGSDQPDEALFEFVDRLASEAASKRNLIDALSGAGFDFKATSSDSKAAFEETFQILLTRAQTAGLVRKDVQPADLMGLVMGACTLATPERTDCSQARMLAIVFAGLRPEPAASAPP
jgi:AcrR family transcriptional regulator